MTMTTKTWILTLVRLTVQIDMNRANAVPKEKGAMSDPLRVMDHYA
jgi:hypothetical protein